MRNSFVAFIGLGAFCAAALITTTAEAQPKSYRRAKPMPARGNALRPAPKPTAPPPNICPSTSAVLRQRQARLDDRNADLAGVEAEINQLHQQLAALENQRIALVRAAATEQVWVNMKQKEYDTQCKQSENCTQYEQLASSLETQTKPYEADLNQVRSEISQQRRTVQDLTRQIDPLRREYAQRKCNDLVAGQTSQSTIDRCAAIFSDWNRMQAQINNANNRIVSLKRRYEHTVAALKNSERRAQNYETYLSRNCRSSKKLAVMRKYRGVAGRAAQLGGELDRLITDVTKLRSLTISVGK